MQIYHMEIPALTLEEMTRMEALLPPERRARLGEMRRLEARAASLFGELAVRYLVGREVGMEPMALTWATGTYGKPFFEGSQCHFNLSHSGAHLAVALDGLPVGIDIECLKPITTGLAERFFSPEEAAAVAASGGAPRIFYGSWTVREAYIKWLGEGFHKTMQSFAVREPDRVEGAPDCYFKRYSGEDFLCSVCSEGEDFPEHMTELDAEELLKALL